MTKMNTNWQPDIPFYIVLALKYGMDGRLTYKGLGQPMHKYKG